MTLTQQLITILMVILGTMLTRYLPFLLFPGDKPTPKYIQYLGSVLPAAVFGLLVVYCLKNVSFLTGSHGIPELISIAVVVVLHLWKRQMLLSIAGGLCAICCWCSSYFNALMIAAWPLVKLCLCSKCRNAVGLRCRDAVRADAFKQQFVVFPGQPDMLKKTGSMRKHGARENYFRRTSSCPRTLSSGASFFRNSFRAESTAYSTASASEIHMAYQMEPVPPSLPNRNAR